MPEVRRLLQVMGVADDAKRRRHLRWSEWRRAHQAVARDGHVRRRSRRAPPPSTMEPRVIPLPETVALSDERWARILPLLSSPTPTIGRPAHDHRKVLRGILWVARTGAPWREIPADFGPWETIHSRYRRWRKEGLWPRIIGALHPPATPSEPG